MRNVRAEGMVARPEIKLGQQRKYLRWNGQEMANPIWGAGTKVDLVIGREAPALITDGKKIPRLELEAVIEIKTNGSHWSAFVLDADRLAAFVSEFGAAHPLAVFSYLSPPMKRQPIEVEKECRRWVERYSSRNEQSPWAWGSECIKDGAGGAIALVQAYL